jgi:hypothetical protein
MFFDRKGGVMASTRSTTRTQRTQPATQADSPRDAFTALARRVAHVQIAVCAAAAKSFAGWAQAADLLAQHVGDELLRRVDGETDSAELVASLARHTGSHLRDLSALPRTATDHFDARLARVIPLHGGSEDTDPYDRAA